jgi:protein tyrosine/serine phosphatase
MGNTKHELWHFFRMLALPIAACSSSVSSSGSPSLGGTGAAMTDTLGGAETGTAGGAGGGSTAPVGGPVVLGGVVNARQTGGLVTADGRHVRANLLMRSGDLYGLDATGCDELAALGVHSIIDLRDATDQSARPDAACATTGRNYQHIELPKLLPPSSDNYLATLVAAEPKLATIFGVLTASDSFPVLIHCVIGRDRASLVTALVLLAVGVPETAVLVDMVQNQDATAQVDPTWMDGVLGRTHQAGGIEAYLASQGVPASTLSTLRASLLE